MSKRKTGSWLNCLICGKEFWAQPSEIKHGRKFCSYACMGKATGNRFRGKPAPWTGKPAEMRHCVICGNEFKTWPSEGPKKCCSRSCADKWHSIRLTGRIMDAQTKNKIGKANKGNKRPDVIKKWEKYRITGERADVPVPFRIATEVMYTCEQCGKSWPSRLNGRAKALQRHFCGDACRQLWRSQRMLVKDNYPLYSREFRNLRETILERDGYLCQRCGQEQCGKSHHVHHIDFDKRNIDINNLITLCAACHGHVTIKRIIGPSILDVSQETIYGFAN